MPTYGKENFKESNVNYLNKDFTSLKSSLINYAKSYFPNTYRDFNETSPGMMLLEMNAYVGDVLSFYIDQQYREMLLPLAEERRNIITMAKMFGYKVKPIVPAFVDLEFTANVPVSPGDSTKVDYSKAGTFDAGVQVVSSTNSNTIFTTLEPIDFRVSGSGDTETIFDTDDAGLVSNYTLTRTVKAISATEKTISFQVGTPEKFKTIIIPDTNVIDIISCIDSNNNKWYEVDFLAQDKVPIETHYTDDINRDSAYADSEGLEMSSAVPYSLEYIKTTKRFTRETNEDNTTSLVFGNGVLKNGQLVDEGFINTQQLGIVVPGQTQNLNSSISSQLGDFYSTLGETPNNTTLTITYRVGGGINSNVPSGDLSTTPTLNAQNGQSNFTLQSVNNSKPAIGGKDSEDIIEIKEQAKAFFSTQNRCVTKEDYEARVLHLPSKFGNIAKVYVARGGDNQDYSEGLSLSNFNSYNNFVNSSQNVTNQLLNIQQDLLTAQQTGEVSSIVNQILIAFQSGNFYDLAISQYNTNKGIFEQESLGQLSFLSTINIYILGYNNLKQLVGNPNSNIMGLSNNVSPLLKQNIKKYLQNFKIMTDVLTIQDGYIVNFGVFFDVIAEKYANKQQVKLNCIQKIKEYFRIEKMQFNQPIYKSQLEFELMGVEGVRSIGHITISQFKDDFYTDNTNDQSFTRQLFSYSFDTDFEPPSMQQTEDLGYGYKYDFKTALSDDGTIIVPPKLSTPTVFELKNPNENIQGRVR
jgi:hypothetical protein